MPVAFNLPHSYASDRQVYLQSLSPVPAADSMCSLPCLSFNRYQRFDPCRRGKLDKEDIVRYRWNARSQLDGKACKTFFIRAPCTLRTGFSGRQFISASRRSTQKSWTLCIMLRSTASIACTYYAGMGWV